MENVREEKKISLKIVTKPKTNQKSSKNMQFICVCHVYSTAYGPQPGVVYFIYFVFCFQFCVPLAATGLWRKTKPIVNADEKFTTLKAFGMAFGVRDHSRRCEQNR